MRSKHFGIPFLLGLFLLESLARAQQVVITPDRTNGVYGVGDAVHWQVEWRGGSRAGPARYTFKKGGLKESEQGELQFTNSGAELTSQFKEPGTMLVEVQWRTDDRKELRTVAGAVADPDRIPLSAPCPSDFDAFWNAKLDELNRVPANPRLETVDIGNSNIMYCRVTMDNIRGTRIYGQLARPAAGGKFPALLIVQWAGVYPLQTNWVIDRAKEGWLALNLQPHDLPVNQPEAFYMEQFKGPLKDYWSIGNDNRETSYYLRMYLSCYRAAEYLRQRDDWDGRTLAVMGDSQGGMQALMTAGLHPRITAALALVPAGCDMLGPDVGRAPGWPHWYSNTDGKDPEKVHQASRYFDVANFASRIRCPVLLGVGLRDEVCPPAGVFAAVNQISSPKQIVILPRSAHQDENGSQAAYNRLRYDEWLPALRQGKPLPLPAPR